ncbi:MAG: V-type ATPase subunit [Clostridia bacterium]|nr:V-type ATPase subunit [Clostridia bacterium]
MALDVTYTNGVIAARDKFLLKDRISRFAELSAEEAFRALVESGFGGGETAANVYDYEKLVAAEERLLDEFILEYAPSDAERAYFLSPRDFHNLKALLKAAHLNESAEKMLAPDGEIPAKELEKMVKDGDFSPLAQRNPELYGAAKEATALFESENVSGAEIGAVFEKANARRQYKAAGKNRTLKKLLEKKIDMINLLTAFRAGEESIAKSKYLPCGTLGEKTLSGIFAEDKETAENALKGTAYDGFVKSCFAAKSKGLPLTEAEKLLDSFETEYFFEKRYELKNKEPFLYYIFRRKTEIANIRIVFVCLLAGLKEQDIKRRLRNGGA